MSDRNKWIALVVGNSQYDFETEVSGQQDAEAISDCFKKLGIQVVDTITNGNFDVMGPALVRFESAMKDPEIEVAIFFYSGHGFQKGGKNYILPKNGAIGSPNLFAVDEDIIQRFASAPEEAVKIVFLNACRQNSPKGDAVGFANPGGAPSGVLQAFAASPGQLAASGRANEISLYTKALLKHLPVPGLDLVSFLDNVRRDVVDGSPDGQQPIIAGTFPQDFFFKDAVEIQAQVLETPNDGLLVILNGDIALNATEAGSKPLTLRPYDNDLRILVSNGRTYRNNHDWDQTDGWSYKLALIFPDGTAVPFGDHEDVPFKDGPHHGKIFDVASARINVDPDAVKVTEKKEDLWKLDPPFYAQDQGILFVKSVTDLNLTSDDLLSDELDLGPWKPVVKVLLADFLKTGKILGQKVADPDNTMATVRGNRELGSIVQRCMTDGRADRIRDLKASIAALLRREPRPFDLFDHGLNTAVQELDQHETGQTRDVRIWTSFEERPPVPAAAGQPSPDSLGMARAAAVEEPAAVVSDSLLIPRPGEALIGPMPMSQNVSGVAVSTPMYPFLTLTVEDSRIKVHARIIVELADLQNKIGAIVDTFPLPTNTRDHEGPDNLVVRIWGKRITIDGDAATLRLNGDADVWLYSRTLFSINTKLINQPFDAALPFTASVADPQSFTLRPGQPTVHLGGALGGLTEKLLGLLNVDLNARAKAALDQAINPAALRQTLPDFLLVFNPVVTTAELVNLSGSLALSLEMDGAVEGSVLARFFELLLGRR